MERVEDIIEIVIAYERERGPQPDDDPDFMAENLGELSERQILINSLMTDEIKKYIEKYTKAVNDYINEDSDKIYRNLCTLEEYNLNDLTEEDGDNYYEMYKYWTIYNSEVMEFREKQQKNIDRFEARYKKYQKLVLDGVNALLADYDRLGLVKFAGKMY